MSTAFFRNWTWKSNLDQSQSNQWKDFFNRSKRPFYMVGNFALILWIININIFKKMHTWSQSNTWKSYLNPRHIVLLHLFHLLLDGRIELVLKLEGLHVVHVAVAVEQIALEGSSGLLLGISGLLGLVLIVSVTRVPGKGRNEVTLRFAWSISRLPSSRPWGSYILRWDRICWSTLIWYRHFDLFIWFCSWG